MLSFVEGEIVVYNHNLMLVCDYLLNGMAIEMSDYYVLCLAQITPSGGIFRSHLLFYVI